MVSQWYHPVYVFLPIHPRRLLHRDVWCYESHMLANKPIDKVSVDLVACHDSMGSRSREATTTPRPCGGIRLLNSEYESPPMSSQPHLYVVFLFRLERAPQESITAGCFKFEVVLPYSVRCDSEFHFQGTYVETEMPLTTASFVFYKNSAGN